MLTSVMVKTIELPAWNEPAVKVTVSTGDVTLAGRDATLANPAAFSGELNDRTDPCERARPAPASVTMIFPSEGTVIA